jgi:hypothetical protein
MYPKFGVSLSQMPTGRHIWEVQTLPFNPQHIERAVRLIVDTVLQCRKCHAHYGIHPVENMQHAMCRLFGHPLYDSSSSSQSPAHAQHNEDNHNNTNANTKDYDFNRPNTWDRGIQCSQLILLVLKRCIVCGFIQIDDAKKYHEFMGVYSHTCLPGALDLLIRNTWPKLQKQHFDTFHLHMTPYAKPAPKTVPFVEETEGYV